MIERTWWDPTGLPLGGGVIGEWDDGRLERPCWYGADGFCADNFAGNWRVFDDPDGDAAPIATHPTKEEADRDLLRLVFKGQGIKPPGKGFGSFIQHGGKLWQWPHEQVVEILGEAIPSEHIEATAWRETLVAARLEAGLTQPDLSEATGLTRSLIAKIETGRATITAERIHQYAKATDTPVELLREVACD